MRNPTGLVLEPAPSSFLGRFDRPMGAGLPVEIALSRVSGLSLASREPARQQRYR